MRHHKETWSSTPHAHAASTTVVAVSGACSVQAACADPTARAQLSIQCVQVTGDSRHRLRIEFGPSG